MELLSTSSLGWLPGGFAGECLSFGKNPLEMFRNEEGVEIRGTDMPTQKQIRCMSVTAGIWGKGTFFA